MTVVETRCDVRFSPCVFQTIAFSKRLRFNADDNVLIERRNVPQKLKTIDRLWSHTLTTFEKILPSLDKMFSTGQPLVLFTNKLKRKNVTNFCPKDGNTLLRVKIPEHNLSMLKRNVREMHRTCTKQH